MGRYLKMSVLLFGAFAIGYNVSAVVHEIGHALAHWFDGGHVDRIVLHPFSWSYTYYDDLPTSPLFVTWAGIGAQLILALPLMVVAWRWRNPWAVVPLMTATVGLLVGGLYLGIDVILLAGGDATELLRLGVSKAAIFALALFLTLGGIVSSFLLSSSLGLSPKDGVAPRLVVLGFGIGAYLAAMLAYHLLLNREEIVLWSTYVGVGFLLVGLWCVGSSIIEAHLEIAERSAVGPSWPQSIAAAACGVAIIAAELLFSA